MSKDRPAYIPPPYLDFTAEQRAKAQAWHDENDKDDQGVTVNQRVEMFRRTEAELRHSRAIEAEKLRNTPPCRRCGAKAGEPCKSIASESKSC